jgi:predicted AAA+ superfamily ATPase
MYQRLQIQTLTQWLFKDKVLVLIGARQVGKSTLLKAMLEELPYPFLNLNGEESHIKKLFEDPTVEKLRQIVGDNKIVLIDEAQQIKNIGLCLKMLFDNLKDVQFIASGSSALEIADEIFEPLTGRHFVFHLYPLSVQEIYTQKGFLKFTENLNWHLVYGMYPDVLNNRNHAKKYLKSIANQYLYKDVLAWKDIRKPDLLNKLLQLLAHQIGCEISLNELATQLKVKSETVDNYIDLLEKSFVLFRLKSYSTNDRKEVTKMRKIYFYDLGIRNAIIDNFSPIELRNDVGALWENFVVMEIIKANEYAQNDFNYYFWRTLQQQEVDFIVQDEQQITAFEMKWGNKGRITKAFTNSYPDAKTEIINPANFFEKIVTKENTL